MAELTLTSGAKPIFLGPNKFNRHADNESDLSVTSQSSLRHRLYDMDPNAYWESLASTDSVQEIIEAGLWDSGVQSLISIDFFAILGHNLKGFTVEFSADNGATWAHSYAYLAQTAGNTLRSLAASISVNRMRVKMDTVHTSWTTNTEKHVGTIVVGLGTFQAPVGMNPYKRRLRVKDKTARMHDGSIRRNYVYRSDASIGFYEASLGFPGLTDAQLTNFRTVLLSASPFCFIPEPYDRPGEIFQCLAVPGTYNENYLSLSRSGGNVITVDVEETGGA